jgi:CheY-like chemotaxis protein
MSMPPSPLLLVEDDDDDRMLFELALASTCGPIPLQFACDGEEALEYLERTGRYAGHVAVALPGLVVLDLKLPRRTGLEVLAQMRGSPALRHVPVVVLSSSQEVSDVARARALGIEEYYVKPVDMADFEGIVRAIGARWDAQARRRLVREE